MRQHIVRQVHSFLLRNRLTIAVAESCTGGLAAKMLTDLAGSSQYFLSGVVAYSNKAKQRILKIPAASIVKNGAVSKLVALKMAQAVKRIAAADIGIGITGIAGPEGGSNQKPVGTVFIAVCAKNKTADGKFLFSGKRAAIRKKAALKALELLYACVYRH